MWEVFEGADGKLEAVRFAEGLAEADWVVHKLTQRYPNALLLLLIPHWPEAFLLAESTKKVPNETLCS